MHLRRFVLAPLCELAPDLVHPVLKKTFRALLASIEDQARVRVYEQPSASIFIPDKRE
jgi:7,8-dihydro-6-hydroxymethylpterin-pyrophosphokinase